MLANGAAGGEDMSAEESKCPRDGQSLETRFLECPKCGFVFDSWSSREASPDERTVTIQAVQSELKDGAWYEAVQSGPSWLFIPVTGRNKKRSRSHVVSSEDVD